MARFESALETESKAVRLGDVVALEDSKRIPLNSRDREARKGPYPYYGATSVMDHVDDYLFDGVRVLLGEDGTVIDSEGKPILQYVWGEILGQQPCAHPCPFCWIFARGNLHRAKSYGDKPYRYGRCANED